MPETLPLPDLPRALRDLTGKRVSYSLLYKRVLDGDLPARREGGRWSVRAGDVKGIAETLGLIEKVTKNGR